MTQYKRLRGFKKFAALSMMGTALALPFPFNSCTFDQFTSTSTVTLDSRDVVSFLLRSWILTPIENVINTGIDKLFEQFDGEEGA